MGHGGHGTTGPSVIGRLFHIGAPGGGKTTLLWAIVANNFFDLLPFS